MCNNHVCTCCRNAYLDGLKDGFDLGVKQTFDLGFKRGFNLGFKRGFDLGVKQGYINGYVDATLGLNPPPSYEPVILRRLEGSKPRPKPWYLQTAWEREHESLLLAPAPRTCTCIGVCTCE